MILSKGQDPVPPADSKMPGGGGRQGARARFCKGPRFGVPNLEPQELPKVKKGSPGGLSAARGKDGGGGGAWGWRFPELSFGRNLQSGRVLEGGKVFPAPTANQVWQGQCCAAIRGKKGEIDGGWSCCWWWWGFRFVECAPDSGSWLEVQLLVSGRGHLF